METLIDKLSYPASCEQARDAIVERCMGKKKAACQQIRARLPTMMQAATDLKVVLTESYVAGELHVINAIPQLTGLLANSGTRNPQGGFTGMSNLAGDTVALALYKMGGASIGALRKTLADGPPVARERAIRILLLMNSLESRRALSDHLPSEDDPALRSILLKSDRSGR